MKRPPSQKHECQFLNMYRTNILNPPLSHSYFLPRRSFLLSIILSLKTRLLNELISEILPLNPKRLPSKPFSNPDVFE